MSSGSTAMFEAAAADDRIPRRLVLVAMARVLGVVAATLLVYFLLPIEGLGSAASGTAVAACAGIAVILIVFARQITRVSRSQRPVLAALDALVLVFGLFLCFFALLYVSLSERDPDAFTQDVNKVAGIYFTMTVLTTVGFGDISAVSDTARIMVTLQMLIGMVLIGTAFKALGFSAKRAVTARTHSSAAEQRDGASGEGDPGSARARG